MHNTRPNILLIMTDQHRHDFVGYAGASWLRTPNLDALAARGTVFTHAFTNSPICAPARCALATGLQAHRCGVLSNRHCLGPDFRTFYQRLQQAGYWTGFAGKLDLLKPVPYPTPQGRSPLTMALGFSDPFEVNKPFQDYLQEHGLLEVYQRDQKSRVPFVGMHGVLALRPHPFSRGVERPEGWVAAVSQDSPLPFEHHKDSYTGRHAVQWVRRHARGEDPWFYQVNFGGPHDPFDPPTSIAERYRDAAVPEPIPVNMDAKPNDYDHRLITDDPEQIRFTRRQYSASIELLDHWVGQLMSALEEEGVLDRTVVVFTSDHGEMLGDHGFYTKHVPYESSIRVPLVVAEPGRQSGRRCDALVELIDLHASVCEWAGLTPTEGCDARSLCPLLAEDTVEHREHPDPGGALRGGA